MKMSCRGWSSLALLLLIMAALIPAQHILQYASAHSEDQVQTSPGIYSHTLGTATDIVKLDYPKSAIMQNATGDISMNITLSYDSSSIGIYIPPEFGFVRPDTTSIWTSVTNDYNRVSIGKLNSTNAIGPLWWNVRIANLTIPMGSYLVRMFNMTAPDICGRYFLKIFIDGESIGAESFPTLAVTCGLHPGYISGHVLSGSNGDYGRPVDVAGRVIAEGITAFGRSARAQAYFDASENGAFVIYGLAPGTYRLNASAAGFAPAMTYGAVTVYAGQSLSGVDIYVYPGPTMSGVVSSKCNCGLTPWGYNSSAEEIARPIKIEISDSEGEQKGLLTGETDPSSAFYRFSFNGSAELDGHVPQDHAGYVSGLEPGDYYLKASVNGYVQRDEVVVHVKDYLRSISVTFDLWCSVSNIRVEVAKEWIGILEVELRSVDWQTPPQEVPWEYPNARIRLEVTGSMGEVYVASAEQEEDATVTIANVTGLPTDIYLVRVYTPGYVQATNYPVSVSNESISGIMINLVKATKIQVTLVFRTAGLIAPIDTYRYDLMHVPARIEVYNSFGVLVGASATYIPLDESDSTVEIIGFDGYAGNPCLRWGNYYDTTDGRLQKDYGLPAGTYLVRAWVPGYFQRQAVTVSTSPGGMALITVYLDGLGRVFGYVSGLDLHAESIPLSWATVTAFGPTLSATSSLDGTYEMWLLDGTYAMAASSPGYETQAAQIRVSSGWETAVDFDLRPVGWPNF